MKLIVDRLLCDSNGLCAVEAPDLLALGDDEALTILKEPLAEDEIEAAERAVAACPKAALRLGG